MDCLSGSISESDEMQMMEENPGSFGGIKRNRTCTDKGFIIGMAAFFLILLAFVGYCASNGDLDKIYNGYDDCGNVCGKDNVKTDSTPFECFGQNMEEKKFLLYGVKKDYYGRETLTKMCVENCEVNGAYVFFLNRCYPNYVKDDKNININFNNKLEELTEDFQLCWKNIVVLGFLAFVFSVIMMVLLRYATAFVVWFILISISLLLIGLTIYLWVLFKTSTDQHEAYDVILQFAIATTIFTFVFLLIVAVMAKRISLVIQLFKESAKAIADIPLLLFQPVLTFLALFIILFMGFYTSMWIISAGYLTVETEVLGVYSYDYVLSGLEIFTSVYNCIAVLWIIQFVIGCQHMIVGGCVATWFFARDKNNLGSPILTSTLNLLRYHLGTVAVGSLIITIVQIIKSIIASLRASAQKKNNLILSTLMCICQDIFQIIEDLLKYFSRNAYIVTAIYGHSFCRSGRHALKLLVNNIFKVVAINSVGDYVLVFMKLFIVLITVSVGAEIFRKNDQIHHLWFPLLIVGLVAFFIAHCFFTIFEMAIDTIFLCFCEDCERNDGLSKPYFMSRNLMEFVEKSNKTMNLKHWGDMEQQAWDNGPKRILRSDA